MREYTSLLKNAKRQFFGHDLLGILRDNPQKFWKYLSPKNSAAQNLPFTNPDGSAVSATDSAEIMNSHFSSIFTHEPSTDVPSLPPRDFPQMPRIFVTSEGIANLIDNLKFSSSPGPDNIPAKILKSTKIISSLILQFIFNQSLDTGFIPKDWKISKVTPVPKSGSPSDPSNYRPISLTCIACKLLEHVIYSHIATHLDQNSFFFSNQHGFRRGLSCETQLYEFSTDLHFNLDSSFQTDVIYLDFSKAFDRVPHRRLISKLSCLSIDPLALSWIKNFLTGRVQYTVVANNESTRVDVVSGVPQGSVLGPLLFIIFINDIPDKISSTIRLFADDCVLYRRISCCTDQITLQNDLSNIHNWCSRWLMQLNTQKCKFMQVSRKRTNFSFQYSVNFQPLTQVDSYRYLGVIITSKLTWSEHIEQLVTASAKSLGYIKRSLTSCPPQIRKLAYETFTRTKLEYASAIWNPHQNYLIDALEAIQNRAARFITSQYSSRLSITSIKLSLNLPPLEIRRKVTRLCLLHKLYHNFPSQRNTVLLPPARSSRRLFNSLCLQRLHGSTNAFNKSFLPTAIEDWNNLPESIVHEQNPLKFKQLITNHLIC